MRKWQQDLVDLVSPESLGHGDGAPERINEFSSQDIQTQECTTGTETELPTEKTKAIKLNEYHIAGFIFLFSALIFCVLKPAIVLTRIKDRPEETQRISYSAVFLLSAFTSAVYLGFCFKLV